MMSTLPSMPPADFASALEEAGLTCQGLSDIIGQPVAVIRAMMLGTMRVDYHTSLTLTLLTLPGAVELARLHADLPVGQPAYIEPQFVEKCRVDVRHLNVKVGAGAMKPDAGA